MSKNIMVSVIIPLFNVEENLKECLESVIAQTLKDIEIICIDDGSVDKTREIAEWYANRYFNVKLLCQNNAGAGAARDRGIKEAKGEFLAFLDADDFYPDKEFLEYSYRKAIEHQVKICGGGLDFLFDDGSIGIDSYGVIRKYKKEGIYNYKDWGHDPGWTRFIYQSELIKKNNIIQGNYRIGQDTLFMLEIFAMAEKFYFYPKSIYIYRVGERKLGRTLKYIKDLLRMIMKALDISKRYQLPLQHSYFIDLFQNYSYVPICAALAVREKDLQGMIDEVYSHIDKKLIENQECNIIDNLYSRDNRNEFYGICMVNREEILERQKECKYTIIYGAGRVGRELLAWLEKQGLGNKILVAVTKLDYAEMKMNGKNVIEIHELKHHKGEAMVLVAAAEKYHTEISTTLSELGFTNVYMLGHKMIGVWKLDECLF